jgi:hypothetical protein
MQQQAMPPEIPEMAALHFPQQREASRVVLFVAVLHPLRGNENASIVQGIRFVESIIVNVRSHRRLVVKSTEEQVFPSPG